MMKSAPMEEQGSARPPSGHDGESPDQANGSVSPGAGRAPLGPSGANQGAAADVLAVADADPGSSKSRAVLQVMVFAVLALIAMNGVAFVALAIPNLFLASALSVFLGSLVATAIAMRIFFQRPATDVGLHWNPVAGKNLAFGVLAGVTSASVVTLLPVMLGQMRWESSGQGFSLGALVVFLVLILFSAIGEEVLFRGFALQRILETFGPWPAVVVTSLVFGWAHAGNLSVDRIALLNTVLWGAVFAAAYLKSRDLWLPIGLHAGWNWTLPLLGVELSGFTLEVTGYRLTGGDSIWDGGAYGPEAGVLTTIVVPAMLFVLWRLPIRRSA